MSIRLQKFLAEAGVASRRASESLIAEGRVVVDGKTVDTPGFKVDPVKSIVSVDGERIRTKKRVYLAINKPRGVVTTKSDPQGRTTVMELIPEHWGDCYPIGRLDMESEGLLLLTNDGNFCDHVSHPRNKISKIYHVRVQGKVPEDIVDALRKGVRDHGEFLHIKDGEVVSITKKHSHLVVELAEGKNREIRRLFAGLDQKVTRLLRTEITPIRLGELKPGRWRTLTDAEIKSLLSP